MVTKGQMVIRDQLEIKDHKDQVVVKRVIRDHRENRVWPALKV